MRVPPHPGSEDAITPALAETRRLYAAAYREALTAVGPTVQAWIDTRRALASQRRPCTRQMAHAEASLAMLARPAMAAPRAGDRTRPIAAPSLPFSSGART